MSPGWRRKLLLWIADHDDSWLFTALYLGLAVVLSMLISLFWLLAVVAAHAALEWYALRERGAEGPRLRLVLWHLKLDLALVLFALALGLYLDTLFGMAGLGAVARTGAQAGTRFLAWQKALRGVLMTLDDAAQVARAVAARKGNGRAPESAAEAPQEAATHPWRARWSVGDRFSIAFGLAMATLILAAPLLTDHDVASTLAALAADLHPWPGG